MARKTEDVPIPSAKRTASPPWKVAPKEKPAKPVKQALEELLPPDAKEDAKEEGGDVPAFNLEDQLIAGDSERTDLDKYLEHMLKPENIHHMTDLSDEEITAFSLLGPIAFKYKLEVLRKFLMEKLKLRVSKGRKGRGELVRIAQRVVQPEPQQSRRFFDFRNR